MSVKSGQLSDADLYAQGRALALAGHYANALDALLAIGEQEDARVLTMIGYAKRKSGRLDEGMAAYARALAIEPDNLDAREYLGEGHVAAGRLDLAMIELETIERICGSRDCEQYLDLAAAIAGEPETGWGE